MSPRHSFKTGPDLICPDIDMNKPTSALCPSKLLKVSVFLETELQIFLLVLAEWCDN